ncbi:hypothetical protein [Ligilactobacillus apodemi]|uniref:hypothetical protein n=1 Tax=Ligilactobacillus apodemi TaxID=307126 RepID=UPI00214B9345|nr:hypothetical protein [Ligilactobacillus apodemi]MCR1900660.1 hypothetical protein [Ligilactobacillus apodemi]
MKYHKIENWFDENGKFSYQDEYIPITNAQKNFKKEVSRIDKRFVYDLGKIKKFSSSFHNYSKTIKLDAVTALALKNAIKSHGQAGIKVIKETKKQVESELENNWRETFQVARQIGSELSEVEILQILHEASADKEALDTKPVKKLSKKVESIEDIQRKISDYDKALSKSIRKRISDDQELAQRFGIS